MLQIRRAVLFSIWEGGGVRRRSDFRFAESFMDSPFWPAVGNRSSGAWLSVLSDGGWDSVWAAML